MRLLAAFLLVLLLAVQAAACEITKVTVTAINNTATIGGTSATYKVVVSKAVGWQVTISSLSFSGISGVTTSFSPTVPVTVGCSASSWTTTMTVKPSSTSPLGTKSFTVTAKDNYGYTVCGSSSVTIKTATTLTPASVSSTPGSKVNLTATLATGTSKLSGRTVQFQVDGASVGSATTATTGVATLAYTLPTSLTTGSHTITAVYAGETGYNASSGTSTLTVGKITPTLSVTSFTSNCGAPVTLTATMTANGAAVAGLPVRFALNGVVVGTANTNASGVATVNATVPTGFPENNVLPIVANYESTADSQYNTVYGNGSITIAKWTTNLSVAASSGASGGSTTLSATLTAGGNAVAGKTVTFTLNGVAVGSGTTNANGVATCTVTIPSGLSAGSTLPIVASFNGGSDQTYKSATGNGTLSINKTNTSLSVATASGAPGANTTVSATLTAGGNPVAGKTVTFSANGTVIGTGITNASGVASLTITVPTGVSAGSTIPISASFNGSTDAVYNSSNGSANLTVTKWATSLSVASASGSSGGGTTLTATLTAGGNPVAGKTVSFTLNGVTVGTGTTDANGVATCTATVPTGLSVGSTLPIVASFDGSSDTAYDSASGNGALTVAKWATSLTVAPASAPAGADATLSATLLTTGGSAVVGKTVTFTIDGATVGTGTTDASGIATCTYTVPAGVAAGTTYPITASFADGDAGYLPSSGSETLTVAKQPSKILTVSSMTGHPDGNVDLDATLKTIDDQPIVGRTIRFLYDGVEVGTAVTDETGFATYEYTLASDSAIGSDHLVTAVFDDASETTYAASSNTFTLSVRRGIVFYIPEVIGSPTDTVNLIGIIVDRITGERLQNFPLDFWVDGTYVGNAVTQANGYAYCPYVIPSTFKYTSQHEIKVAYTMADDPVWEAWGRTGVLTIKQKTRITGPASFADGPGATVSLYAVLQNYPQFTAVTAASKTLDFSVDGVYVGSAATNSAGTATLSYTIPADTKKGDHVVTVDFAATDDVQYLPSPTFTTTLTVGKYATKIAALAKSGAQNASITLQGVLATRSSATRLTGKTLTFLVDGQTVGTATTAASPASVAGYGNLPFTVPATWAVGSKHTVTIQFAGDTDNLSTASSTTITVASS